MFYFYLVLNYLHSISEKLAKKTYYLARFYRNPVGLLGESKNNVHLSKVGKQLLHGLLG